MECVDIHIFLDEYKSNIYLDIYLISSNSNNMVSFTKAIVAFLLACLGISAATPPSNDALALDDTIPLNDTLPLNDALPLNGSLTVGTPPKREDWKSAWIACENDMKPFWYNYKITGEGWVRREEEVERKVKTAADRVGLVTKWKVAHYPPQENRNSSVTITVSPPFHCAIATYCCSFPTAWTW